MDGLLRTRFWFSGVERPCVAAVAVAVAAGMQSGLLWPPPAGADGDVGIEFVCLGERVSEIWGKVESFFFFFLFLGNLVGSQSSLHRSLIAVFAFIPGEFLKEQGICKCTESESK